MKVGFLLDSFPKLSETFILNQITDLIDNHVNVSIFVLNHPVETVIHDKYFRYGLDKLTTYAPRMPYSHTKKIQKGHSVIFSAIIDKAFRLHEINQYFLSIKGLH
jgi:colanic acid/amylovoran biosynthesis glycosyltransferase